MVGYRIIHTSLSSFLFIDVAMLRQALGNPSDRVALSVVPVLVVGVASILPVLVPARLSSLPRPRPLVVALILPGIETAHLLLCDLMQ